MYDNIMYYVYFINNNKNTTRVIQVHRYVYYVQPKYVFFVTENS